jgi:hypothetical protein
MGKKVEFTKEQVKEIIRLYTEEKMGTPAIGKAIGAHKVVINRTLKENGVVLDQPGRRNIGGKPAAAKRYYKKRKPELQKYHKEWSENNREELREYHAEWRKDNPENAARQRDYERTRRATDPKYRLAARTRTAVWTCLKEADVAKYRSTFETLGYTLDELISHLEALFTEGMNWENYGLWHVDHKIPMAKFNFTSTDDHEFKLCWCLDNLQPMWAMENYVKGSK